MDYRKPEKTLKLTHDDLIEGFKRKTPEKIKFYHFLDRIKALDFSEATLIIYTDSKGNETVLKDEYNRSVADKSKGNT